MKNAARGIVFIAVVLGIVALGHFAVYEALARFWNVRDARALGALRVAFVVLALSFPALSLATMPRYTKIGAWLYTLSAVWLGTLYWLVMASALGALALPFFGTLPGRLFFALAILTSIYGIWNSNNTLVSRYVVHIKNLPESWRGKRAALVSDLHLGNVRGRRFAEKIVRMVNAERPEIVFLAGDFFDGPDAPFERFAAPLKKIAAPKGAYFAEGNHEEFTSSGKYDRALRAAGVHVLKNQKTLVEGVEIIGIDYAVSNGDGPTRDVLKKIGVSRDVPSILIKHAPTGIAAVAESGIDLQVSGHTHRGQVWPFESIAKKVFGEFEYGMHEKDTLTVVTSSGAGTWGPIQRVGTHAEIVIVTLERC